MREREFLFKKILEVEGFCKNKTKKQNKNKKTRRIKGFS